MKVELQRCKDCNELKLHTSFANAGVKKGKQYYRKICKSCFNIRKSEYKLDKKREYAEWKETLECSKCGYSKETNKNFVSQHLHLHHIKKKRFNVSDLMRQGLPLYGKMVQKELKNCIVLCGRCHDYEHFKDG